MEFSRKLAKYGISLLQYTRILLQKEIKRKFLFWTDTCTFIHQLTTMHPCCRDVDKFVRAGELGCC